ncbi:MAG: hypothetical protein ABR601_01300 [Parasphingopyxis sp.]|nr:hypothetical protein [Sphingomonadales bacterium]
MTDRFELPPHIRELVSARNKLKEHYSNYDLRFTFDGNLVGDLGEAVAAEMFALELTGRSNEGVDGYAPDGRSVQIKASGTRRGPAFRPVDTKADHLLVFHFNYDECSGEIIYNGPEEPVVGLLPDKWTGQRCVSLKRLTALNDSTDDRARLPFRSTK